MSIGQRAPKRLPLLKDIRRKAREENLSPDEQKFYPGSKPVKGGAVAKGFNALAVPKWHRYSLLKYGQPFNYQGTRTRRFRTSSILKLFDMEYSTLTRWIAKGQFPEPFMTVARPEGGRPDNYWLYHQVAPVYVWYKHLKARGLKIIKPTEADFKVLTAALKRAERKWLNLLGEEYTDPYTRVAGKYGVIWIEPEN